MLDRLLHTQTQTLQNHIVPEPVVCVYSHPGAGLRETPLDEDLLADVPQRVGDRTGRDIASKTISQSAENYLCSVVWEIPEHVTEVPAGVAVPGHVREVAGVVAPHAPHPVITNK